MSSPPVEVSLTLATYIWLKVQNIRLEPKQNPFLGIESVDYIDRLTRIGNSIITLREIQKASDLDLQKIFLK